MKKYFTSYFNTAMQIVLVYKGDVPLSQYLKKFFSQQKKFGSNDRKQISHLCYSYFRLGHALQSLMIEDRLRIALFLCSNKAGNWLSLLPEKWQSAYDENLPKRLSFIQSQYPFEEAAVFPFTEHISKEINISFFIHSHFIQPYLFIRIRPAQLNTVIQKLNDNTISFQHIGGDCIAFSNSTNIEAILQINKEVVVQDFSSQQTGQFMRQASTCVNIKSIWDCCAASGGKSILAYDILPSFNLIVSDVRLSIIQNLHQRFKEAGIQQYTSFVKDLTVHQQNNQKYDLVICDAPCSGSGTWSRTPEQLYFFTLQKLKHYVRLQQAIVYNIIPSIQHHGCFLYITCSVFKEENEEMIAYINHIGSLQLLQASYIKGYDKKADTLFAALFFKE